MEYKFTIGDAVRVAEDNTIHRVIRPESDDPSYVRVLADGQDQAPYDVPAGRVSYFLGIQRWFAYGHLPAPLQKASEPFHFLANHLVATLPVGNPQLDVALQKLLEAKDAAVRARMP